MLYIIYICYRIDQDEDIKYVHHKQFKNINNHYIFPSTTNIVLLEHRKKINQYAKIQNYEKN